MWSLTLLCGAGGPVCATAAVDANALKRIKGVQNGESESESEGAEWGQIGNRGPTVTGLYCSDPL